MWNVYFWKYSVMIDCCFIFKLYLMQSPSIFDRAKE